MDYEFFVYSIKTCPVCGEEMNGEKIFNYFNAFVLFLTCTKHSFHCESYYCEEHPFKIKSISIFLSKYFVIWNEGLKELSLTDADGNVAVIRRIEDKNINDWLFYPYKNIITKAQSLIILI